MKFYRYEIHSDYNSKPYIALKEYDLIEETPKGYWIGSMGIKIRWISMISRKRYAYPNKDEALYNLVRRTKVRVRILENQLYVSSEGLKLAENFVIS